jgi:multidrug resistance protein
VPGARLIPSRPLASSMFAPGIPGVMKDFHSSSVILASFVVSVYLIGYSFGPLVCAPMSEIYGRWPVYQATNVLFICFTVACAVAPSLDSLIGFRFLAGAAGSAPLVLGGGSVADLYTREERGSKMAVFSIGPLIGPVAGPVAGAFLAEAEGWRWVFWVITIAAGLVTIACLIFMRETYHPVLLERKAARLRASTSNPAYRSKLATDDTPRTALLKALIRPTKMFFMSPIVFIFVIYTGIIYGYLYLLFTTITEVYEQNYGFSTGTAGLSYLGIGVGMFLGLGIFGATTDKRIQAQKAKGNTSPEIRLEGLIPAAACIPIGLFWYGWSVEKHVHWIMPIIGTSWVGLGLIGIFVSRSYAIPSPFSTSLFDTGFSLQLAVQTYLVDCYPMFAASVTAANTVVRSLVGAFLPLAGRPLYSQLGLGWGNSLLGFIALAMVPLPFVFMKFGARLRTHPKFQVSF